VAARRLPFTLITLGLLGGFAIASGSIDARLPHMVVQRVGFAPRDLPDFDWSRIINSALFTHGGLEFWGAALMIVLAVGVAEWFAGTAFATATFWGVHVATLILESALALPMKLGGLGIGEQILDVRDVGPSAGYVAALGAVCALLPKPWRYACIPPVLALLVALTFTPQMWALGEGAAWSATIAHLIAFPLGWLALAAWRAIRGADARGHLSISASAEITP
jgi:hypothetical protein